MKRALISVYDKTNIIEFAQGLVTLGWEIISTGGTKQLLEDSGVLVTSIEEVTNFPEILGGRVKTLNPYIHGGILYRRGLASDVETIQEQGIGSIDMVVNTLYPFEETVAKDPENLANIIENIDIGGPSMIRAAAKNYQDVIIITNPEDYTGVLDQLATGDLGIAERQRLAAKAFRQTAFYDAMIAEFFTQQSGETFPELLTQAYHQEETLRYGENPHQEAVYYKKPLNQTYHLEQLHGKQISYNNYNDMRATIELVNEFQEPVCVAVKHANPCGVAIGETPAEAYRKAYECDPVSIYGGIIGFNREIDQAAAELLSQLFIEIVIAPGYTDVALEILTRKEAIRLVVCPNLGDLAVSHLVTKETVDGVLVQERDRGLYAVEYSESGAELKSSRTVTMAEMADLEFAWKVAKHCDSNAMVVARNGQTLGLGHGEVRRVWALENALKRSEFDLKDAVVASDGFFFEDTMDTLHEYGIKAIMQPGGSIQDPKVIDAADKYNIALLFTGMRHFKH